MMNETLMSKATNGDSNLWNSLINHVGTVRNRNPIDTYDDLRNRLL